MSVDEEAAAAPLLPSQVIEECENITLEVHSG